MVENQPYNISMHITSILNSKGDECDLVGEELTLSFAAVVD